jgi:isovaleryl-CoA dehydrogenase
MHFDLRPEQQAFRETVRAFATREIAPLAAQMDATDAWPDGLWERLGAQGLLGIGIPEAYGGSGGDHLDFVLAGEELAYRSAAVALSLGAHANLCAYNLYRNGDESQRQAHLPDLCAGRRVGALCITEPDTGSDAVGMQARAVRDGDAYVLTGTKTWITNGPVADLYLVYAKTDPAAGARGISAFLVEKGAPGLSVSKPFTKMGCRGSQTGQVYFEGVRVPARARLGPEGGGVHVLMSGLDVERAVFAAIPVGQHRRALDLALDYAQARSQFGRPIADFQLIQARLADMDTTLEAARLLVWRAAVVLSQAARGGKGSPGHRLAAQALLFAAEACEAAADSAVQIHGGNGFSEEFEVNRIYRDARLGTLGAGTSEIRRLIIARELLARPSATAG